MWIEVGSVDAIVVGREGQWTINNEEEKSNDERGGGGGGAAVAAAIFATLVRVFVCACAACCCCCWHHGAPVLIFLRFSTDSSLPYNLCGASQIAGSEPSVPTTRKKIASPTECTFSRTCTLSAPDLVVPSVWLVVIRAFALVVVR